MLLLIAGFLAGPISGLIEPDRYFGNLLFPLVSISVAIILFEGGLSLKISELKSVGKVVTSLITIGIVITWFLTSLSAYYILGMNISLSILLGAILVVTGPTVIMPILRFVKPSYQVNSLLKWEGIINDSIGAVLAILVFEVIISSSFVDAEHNTYFRNFKDNNSKRNCGICRRIFGSAAAKIQIDSRFPS